MAKKLKLKHMVKWMKRKSDPTRGFVKKILAAKNKRIPKREEKKKGQVQPKWMEKDFRIENG